MTKPKAGNKASDELIVSTRAVAEFFGITQRAVQLWVKDGGCPKIRHGIFDLKAVFAWWQENIADISANGDESTQDIKREYWRAKGEYERVRVDQLKGTLIAREKVEKGWGERIITLFAGLENLKNRLPPILQGKSIAEMSEAIESELNLLREGLKKPGEYFPEVEFTCKTKAAPKPKRKAKRKAKPKKNAKSTTANKRKARKS